MHTIVKVDKSRYINSHASRISVLKNDSPCRTQTQVMARGSRDGFMWPTHFVIRGLTTITPWPRTPPEA